MTSHLEYGQETTGTEVADAFSSQIKGKNVLITGVSPSSLGSALATIIAHHRPATLILASRTKSKVEAVIATIAAEHVHPKIVVLDLSSQSATREAAAEVAGLVDHIDVLINNAAVTSSERSETADGLESQFGVNHIGHFLFTSLLTPLLLAAREARVVNVSSLGYRLSPIRFHDYNFEGNEVPEDELQPRGLPDAFKVGPGRPYQGFAAYGQSKTANILHAVGLNEKGVRAYAVHPGGIWTDLSRSLTPEDVKIIEGTSSFWKTHDQGVATILVAAFDPKLGESGKGVFLSDSQFVDVSKSATDPDTAERLWALSEKIVGGHARL